MLGIRDGNWRIANFSNAHGLVCFSTYLFENYTTCRELRGETVNDKISSQAGQVQVRISKYTVAFLISSGPRTVILTNLCCL